MQAVAFLRTFDAGATSVCSQAGQAAGEWTQKREQFGIHKSLISLQSHKTTEAKSDFGFVTALRAACLTGCQLGFLGGHEAIDWRSAHIGSAIWIHNPLPTIPIPAPFGDRHPQMKR